MSEEQKQNNIEEKAEMTELQKCEAQRDEYLAGWQRAKADFINYKKEEMVRLEEFARYQNADLVMELVRVLDSFDLGIAALEKKGGVDRGVYMIRAQLEDLLKQRGLQRIVVKPGDKFDPAIAETVAEVESDVPAGNVVEEIEAGYKLYDKILRPARVKISKGQTK